MSCPRVPAALAAEAAAACEGAAVPQASATDLDGPEAPDGMSFRKVAPPLDQPQLPRASAYPELPGTIELPDIAAVAVPGTGLLADRSGTR